VSARRLIPLALAVVLGLATAPAVRADAPSAADLEAELVCPTCKTTLDMSDAPVARRMKAIIRARLASGMSESAIKAELVDQFGPGVLAEPPKRGFDLLAWVLPLGGVAAGVVGVGLLAWGWSRRRVEDDVGEPPLDPELDRRVEDELARFDV
jgi:cytochrome c-type biogenesis protein CcmH